MSDHSGTLLKYIRENCYGNSQNSDVTVRIDGKTLHYHRIILVQSPFFEALLSNRWADGAKKQDNELPVYDIQLPEDTSLNAFESVIACLYGIDNFGMLDMSLLHEKYIVAKYLSLVSLSQEVYGPLEKLMVFENVSSLCETFLQREHVPDSEQIQSMVMRLLFRYGAKLKPEELMEYLRPDQLDSIWRSDALFIRVESDRLSSLLKLYFLAVESSEADWMRTIAALLKETVYYEHVPSSMLNYIARDGYGSKISGLSESAKVAQQNKVLLRQIMSKCSRSSSPSLNISQECSSDEEGKNNIEPLFTLDNFRSTFAPFRFSWSFNKNDLSSQRRVYSRIYFYAGSVWRVYLINDGQVRVYLMRSRRDVNPHRARSISTVRANSKGNVDEFFEVHQYVCNLGCRLYPNYCPECPGNIQFLGSGQIFEPRKYYTSRGQRKYSCKQTPVRAVTIRGTKWFDADDTEMSTYNNNIFYYLEDYYDDVRDNLSAHFKLVVSSEKAVAEWSDTRSFSIDQSFGRSLPEAFVASASYVTCNVSILLA